MTGVLIIFIVIIILLAALMAVVVMLTHRRGVDSGEEFLDDENRHVYYDRSLIEKEEFRKTNPGVKGVRTIRRLLRSDSSSKN